MKRTATPKQIEAARRNGARSRGPVTAAGRAVSRLNALTHGLSAKTNALPLEIQADYADLLARLTREHGPAAVAPEALEACARASVRLRQAAAQEAAIMAEEMRAHPDTPAAFLWFDSPRLRRLARYEARHQRQLRASVQQMLAAAEPTTPQAKNEPGKPITKGPESDHATPGNNEHGAPMAKGPEPSPTSPRQNEPGKPAPKGPNGDQAPLGNNEPGVPTAKGPECSPTPSNQNEPGNPTTSNPALIRNKPSENEPGQPTNPFLRNKPDTPPKRVPHRAFDHRLRDPTRRRSAPPAADRSALG